MKRFTLLILLALVALAAPMAAQIQTTTVTGTVHDYFNQPLPNAPYKILEVRRGGMIIPMTEFTDYTDSLGALSFNLPRSNYATHDTTKFRIYINAPEYNRNGEKGVWLALPDTSTVVLSTLPRSTYTPPGVAVIVQNTGSTAAPYGDSLYVADSLARVARALAALALTEADTAQMMAAANAILITAAKDSARFANQRLDVAEATVAAQGDTATAHRAQIDTKQNVLSAAQLARIDSLLAAGVRVSIVSVGLIRVISIDTTGMMLGDLYSNLVSEVQSKLNRSDSVTTYATAWQYKVINDSMNVWRPLVYAPSGTGGAPIDSIPWTKAADLIRPKAGITRVEVPRLIVGGVDDVRYGAVINTNLKLPIDSLILVGTTKMQTLIFDTARLIYGDTLIGSYELVKMPIAARYHDRAHGIVRWRLSGVSANGYQAVRIVADTTNGWQIGTVNIRMTSKLKGGVAPYFYTFGGLLQKSLGYAASFVPEYGTALRSTAVYNPDVLANGNMTSWAFYPLIFYGGNATGLFLFEIEVEVHFWGLSATANPASTFITIDGL